MGRGESWEVMVCHQSVWEFRGGKGKQIEKSLTRKSRLYASHWLLLF